jgi:hypothetical protein
MTKPRYILERRAGGGFVELNHRYHPPKVQIWQDPLHADRFLTPEEALETIGGVFKQRPEDYRVRKLHVEVMHPLEPMCATCGKRPGTRRWGDALALSHGGGALRCEPCVLRAQIAHAEERAAVLPELRQRLKELEGHDLSDPPEPDDEPGGGPLGF